MIAASYKPKKKFMQLAIAEAKRARDRGDYAIGAVITRVTDGREVVIASAGNRVKTSGSRIKHQACGVGNAQIRIERLWPLPDRVRALHHARTLRDVCRC
jgi:tRNA(Arg) A34 adenosine deaminase TadA